MGDIGFDNFDLKSTYTLLSQLNPSVEVGCCDARMTQSHAHSKEATMASPDRPSFFGRDDNPFRTLFREVHKTFEDLSRPTPFARLTSDLLSPTIDVAESKVAIEVTAELPGVYEKDGDVTLANGILPVRGEKKTERDEH